MALDRFDSVKSRVELLFRLRVERQLVFKNHIFFFIVDPQLGERRNSAPNVVDVVVIDDD